MCVLISGWSQSQWKHDKTQQQLQWNNEEDGDFKQQLKLALILALVSCQTDAEIQTQPSQSSRKNLLYLFFSPPRLTCVLRRRAAAADGL